MTNPPYHELSQTAFYNTKLQINVCLQLIVCMLPLCVICMAIGLLEHIVLCHQMVNQ